MKPRHHPVETNVSTTHVVQSLVQEEDVA